MNYDYQKRKFYDAAIRLLPNLKDSSQITTKQIRYICDKANIGYPQYYLANSRNSISRGLYKFSVNLKDSITYEPGTVIKSDTNINFQTVVEDTYTNIPEQKSNDELYNEIKSKYESLELLVDSVGNGVTTSLIVSGAPGIGKSHTVNEVLETNPTCQYTIVKGMVKATGIFKLLYQNRLKNQVIIFDDSDEVFNNEISLNLLKGALELNKTRHLSWLSEKEFVDEDGETIPKTFSYEGGIIFLTNIDFLGMIAKGNKLSPHLQALESRTIYFDLGIRTNQELMVRIKQVTEFNNILAQFGISRIQERLLLEYMETNMNRLRELSIRTLQKLASLCNADPFGWEVLADQVLLRK